MAETAYTFMSDSDALARGALYGLLSQAFRYPTREGFQSIQTGEFASDLLELLGELPGAEGLVESRQDLREKLQGAVEAVSFEEFETDYVRTFDVGASRPPCPPYEGLYRKGEARTEVLLKVSEFYKHFGLAMSQEEGKRELADHLGAELEFLHFLCFKEAQALEEGQEELLAGYRRAQRDFLQLHLLQWLPEFCERMGRRSFAPVHTELARLTLDMLWTEGERLGSPLREAAEATPT